MKELECQFTGKGQVKGFLFTQLKSNDNAYLYEVRDGELTHYEIFKRKKNIRFNCVSYPKNNSFGLWAFTTRDYNRALQIFVDLSFNKMEDDSNE